MTSHQCPSCGTAWQTFWDGDGWPVERLLAPVSAETAARNRGALEAALRKEPAA